MVTQPLKTQKSAAFRCTGVQARTDNSMPGKRTLFASHGNSPHKRKRNGAHEHAWEHKTHGKEKRHGRKNAKSENRKEHRDKPKKEKKTYKIVRNTERTAPTTAIFNALYQLKDNTLTIDKEAEQGTVHANKCKRLRSFNK